MLMTNAQLYLAIGVPLLVNSVAFVAVYVLLLARINASDAQNGARFDAVNQRINDLNQRFDDLRDLWRAELRRVEDVLDARLKHIEER